LFDAAEVTVYVEAYSDDNPAFNAPWSPGNPVISVKLGDRRSMGTEILALTARDPLRSGAPISQFQLLNNDDDLVLLTPDGKLQLNRDLPYDATNQVRKQPLKQTIIFINFKFTFYCLIYVCTLFVNYISISLINNRQPSP
jgi:hypothetical protein